MDLNSIGNTNSNSNINNNLGLNVNSRLDKNDETQRILKNNYFTNNSNNFIKNNMGLNPIMNINVIKKVDDFSNNSGTYKAMYNNFKTPTTVNTDKNNLRPGYGNINSNNNSNSSTMIKRNNTGDPKKNVSTLII